LEGNTLAASMKDFLFKDTCKTNFQTDNVCDYKITNVLPSEKQNRPDNNYPSFQLAFKKSQDLKISIPEFSSTSNPASIEAGFYPFPNSTRI
jgi:hypothetical protein